MTKQILAALVSISTVVGAVQATAQDSPKLTPEIIHGDPALEGPRLRAARISPDGALVTLLRGREDNARLLDLWAYDLATGENSILVRSTDLAGAEAELSEEEKNRRERQRIYESGIVEYAWDAKGEALLFPLGGDIFLYDLARSAATRLTETEAFETDAKVSPSGGYVSYVRDDELYVYDLVKERERRLTSGADGTIRNGVSEFVAQEELNRDTGYWWSPDDERIAYTQIDESPVRIAERLDFGKDGAKTIRQRYPFAGTDNVTIKLGVVRARGGRTKWIDLGDDPDIYIADVYWSTDGTVLYVARLSRDQKRLDLLAADPRSGTSRVIVTETSDTWVNFTGEFHALESGGFLWGSERTGFHHIYRYDRDGTLLGAVTEGDWPVRSVSCVNEETGTLYFTGWTASALESHLSKVSLDNGTPEQITDETGRHRAVFAEDCSVYIGSFSSPDQPSQTAVYKASGERLTWLNENRLDQDHPYYSYLASHITAKYGIIESEDGTPLDYKLLKPTGLKPGEKRAAVIVVYGGPHAQLVSKGWGGTFEQLLADQGYVVFVLDNRGAANRGKAFEDHIYRRMGDPEVKDQAVGARWLGARDYVDADRIGVFGWSYGGYMTLMMLSQNPELYAAGVAGAPVTDWALYDTAYTERYMGDPERDAGAYEQSAVLAHLDGMRGEGELMLIHGMADDNVVFLNSIRLMDALQSKGKTFELMTYPGEKHGLRSKPNRIHRDRLILDFFARKLAGN